MPTFKFKNSGGSTHECKPNDCLNNLPFYFTIELSNIQGECKPMIGDNKKLPFDYQSNLGYETCQTGEWKYEVMLFDGPEFI